MWYRNGFKICFLTRRRLQRLGKRSPPATNNISSAGAIEPEGFQKSTIQNFLKTLGYQPLFIACLFFACQSPADKEENVKSVEVITRRSDDPKTIPTLKKVLAPQYPWEKNGQEKVPLITKEYFRCNGSYLNPERKSDEVNHPVRTPDCEGGDRHSLPLRDGREYIYDILITLLNYVQNETGKHVVITSGHRCPQHNTYVDSCASNRCSKHMIGAEVSFFVEGMENHPETIIELILNYYKTASPFKYDPEFSSFDRYEKEDTNVSVKPWYNKEVFVKLFQANEGRNFDNRHPYPYIAIQVRYDTQLNQRVVYSWDKAHKNFLRTRL